MNRAGVLNGGTNNLTLSPPIPTINKTSQQISTSVNLSSSALEILKTSLSSFTLVRVQKDGPYSVPSVLPLSTQRTEEQVLSPVRFHHTKHSVGNKVQCLFLSPTLSAMFRVFSGVSGLSTQQK